MLSNILLRSSRHSLLIRKHGTEYKILGRVGQGSFSEVLKCQERSSGLYFAAKRLKKECFTLAELTDQAELKAMKLSQHLNILNIIEYHVDPLPGKVTFIFELMDMSLYDLIKNRKRPLPEIKVKEYLYQILNGLNHLHHHGLFHRDIKPENILIKNSTIKVADLGSIRGVYSRPPHTEYISTRWYRSPECLLTSGYYGSKMDIWATGCVFYELLTTKPLFPGTNEVDQLTKIHNVLGTPSPRLLAKFHKNKSENYEYFFSYKPGTGLLILVSCLTVSGQDLLRQMLTYNPERRPNVRRLLEHRYFSDLRDHEMVRTPVTRKSSGTTERRNPVLLSCMMSGDRKRNSKVVKTRSRIVNKEMTSVLTGALHHQTMCGGHQLNALEKRVHVSEMRNMRKQPWSTELLKGVGAGNQVLRSMKVVDPSLLSSAHTNPTPVPLRHHQSTYHIPRAKLPQVRRIGRVDALPVSVSWTKAGPLPVIQEHVSDVTRGSNTKCLRTLCGSSSSGDRAPKKPRPAHYNLSLPSVY